MLTVINEDKIFVFDEIGWGDTVFSPHATAKELISEYFQLIYRVEFYSAENVIAIRMIEPSVRAIELDYWFRNINYDLLNFLCENQIFRAAVKKFFIGAGFSSFSAEDYPLLAATLLGNNNEY